MNFGIVKDHGHTYKFYLNHYFVLRTFKYDDGAKFCGCVAINTEPLCVELCNFVQCHIFVNYLTSAINE
jgi:hypothetical protein